MSAQYAPGVALEDPRPLEAQVASYDASLNAPIPLAEQTFLVVGSAYHVESVSFANAPPGFVPLRAFHSVELSALLVQLLPRDWALSVRVAPGMGGDFAAVDEEMVRLSAVALATHAFTDDFVLGGGGLVSYSFGSFLPLPALYVDWQAWSVGPADAPIATFRIEAFVPAFASLKHTLFDRVELGMRVEVFGNEYAVRDERIADAWPCVASAADVAGTAANEAVAQPAECLDHVAYSTGIVGAVAGVRLFETVWLSALAGGSVFRRFEMLNADDEGITGGAQMVPNTFLFRGGLTWRLPVD